MEGKGSFIILLAIVAFLSLTLAVLAGYVFFVGGSSSKHTPEVTATRPKDEDLASKKIFEGKKYFNLKSENDNKIAVIQVTGEIQYFKKVKGLKDTKAKLDFYDSEIKKIIGSYFQNMTKAEVEKPETRSLAEKDLAKKINELLNSSEDAKYEIVYKVVFDDWFYQ